MKMARVFVQWIEQRFNDCWPADLDPDRAALLERAHMSLLADLPTWTMRLEMKRLTQLWLHLPPDLSPHPRLYHRVHCIPSGFMVMQEAEQKRLTMRAVAPSVPRPALMVRTISCICILGAGVSMTSTIGCRKLLEPILDVIIASCRSTLQFVTA